MNRLGLEIDAEFLTRTLERHSSVPPSNPPRSMLRILVRRRTARWRQRAGCRVLWVGEPRRGEQQAGPAGHGRLTGPGWVRDRFVRQRLGQEVVGSTVPRTPDHWGEGSAREGDLGIGIVGCLKGSRTCYENRHQ